MKDYWDEMCGALYNQAEVTGEPKIHGVPEYGWVRPPIGGRGGQKIIGIGDPNMEDTEVGSDLQ